MILSRYTALLIIFFFCSIGYVSINTALLDLWVPTQGSIAGATMSLGAEVPATPTNTLYQELQEREKKLTEREKAQEAKESYFNTQFEPTPGTIKFLYLLIGALFILIVINFSFDIHRYYSKTTI